MGKARMSARIRSIILQFGDLRNAVIEQVCFDSTYGCELRGWNCLKKASFRFTIAETRSRNYFCTACHDTILTVQEESIYREDKQIEICNHPNGCREIRSDHGGNRKVSDHRFRGKHTTSKNCTLTRNKIV